MVDLSDSFFGRRTGGLSRIDRNCKDYMQVPYYVIPLISYEPRSCTYTIGRYVTKHAYTAQRTWPLVRVGQEQTRH